MTPVPQKGSRMVLFGGRGPQRLMRIWASFGGSMPTRASRAGRFWSREA